MLKRVFLYLAAIVMCIIVFYNSVSDWNWYMIYYSIREEENPPLTNYIFLLTN